MFSQVDHFGDCNTFCISSRSNASIDLEMLALPRQHHLRRVGAATLKAKPLSLASLAEAGLEWFGTWLAGSACLDLPTGLGSIHPQPLCPGSQSCLSQAMQPL